MPKKMLRYRISGDNWDRPRNKARFEFQNQSVKTAVVVEYTDCISAEGKVPSQTSVLNMALNNMIVMLQSKSSRECWVPLYCHHSQVHLSPGVVAPDSVLSIGQIELFDI